MLKTDSGNARNRNAVQDGLLDEQEIAIGGIGGISPSGAGRIGKALAILSCCFALSVSAERAQKAAGDADADASSEIREALRLVLDMARDACNSGTVSTLAIGEISMSSSSSSSASDNGDSEEQKTTLQDIEINCKARDSSVDSE